MSSQTPPVASTKQQLLEREAECRHMSTLRSLAPERRAELERLANVWATLAKAQTEAEAQ